jgi:HEAT repeat protein
LEAIAELGRLGTIARAAAPLLGRLLRDRDPIQRQALLESLTALGEAAEEAALQLAPLARQPDFTVAAIAAWESMGSAAVPEILLLLESRRDCFDPCCDALARLGPQAAAAAPRLAALLPAFESFRRERLCEVLGSLGAGGAPAVPALIECLNDDRSNIRLAACRALRDIAADADTAVPALRQALAFALNESDGVEMRIASCEALAAFGPLAAAAEPELRRAKADYRTSVIAAARAALIKIGVEP